MKPLFCHLILLAEPCSFAGKNVPSDMFRVAFTLIGLITFLTTLCGCAKVGPPPGGPVDKTPPEIAATYPHEGTINFDPGELIELEFSEAIKRESVAASFTVSPPPPGKVKAKWRGKKLKLIFDPPLLEDKTYVLTLGTQLKDMRGVAQENSFHLAFSTGDKLDRGAVKGKLYCKEEEVFGWFVSGYLLDEFADNINDNQLNSQRDPDPSSEPPHASTQAAADGSWELRNLRQGRWRIFAYSDKDKDHLWTPGLDLLAVPSMDVDVIEPTLLEQSDDMTAVVDSIEVELPDTEPTAQFLALVGKPRVQLPFPIRTSARTKDLVGIRFDRKLPSLDASYDVGESVEIIETWYDPGDSSRVMLKLKESFAEDSLKIIVSGSFGTTATLDTTLTVSMKNAPDSDTLGPQLLLTIPELGKRLFSKANRVIFIFNEPVKPPVLELEESKGAILSETDNDSLPDSVVITASILAIAGSGDTLRLKLENDDPFAWDISVDPGESKGSIRFELFGDNISDLNGNTLFDSLLSYNYEYLPDDSLGTISGTVDAGSGDGVINLVLNHLEDKYPSRELMLKDEQNFLFESVPAGKWWLEGWLDSDSNGVFTPGSAVPFEPSDIYTQSSDTIFVRARWESGENKLVFPQN